MNTEKLERVIYQYRMNHPGSRVLLDQFAADLLNAAAEMAEERAVGGNAETNVSETQVKDERQDAGPTDR